jgi:hypothetical protein
MIVTAKGKLALFFLRRFRTAAHRKFVAQLQQPAKIGRDGVMGNRTIAFVPIKATKLCCAPAYACAVSVHARHQSRCIRHIVSVLRKGLNQHPFFVSHALKLE